MRSKNKGGKEKEKKLQKEEKKQAMITEARETQ